MHPSSSLPEAPSAPPTKAAESGPERALIDERLAALDARRQSSSGLKRAMHFWLRWAHVYSSMIGLLIMLFFGITGITLNHPSWTFGAETRLETLEGTLPGSVMVGTDVELLLVSEFVRAEHGVKGEVEDFAVDGSEGAITYKAPGYGAELAFDADTLEYAITIQEEGFVGVMNELHKGRDSSTMWRWIIDISGALLVVIALTGLGIQLFMRKRRLSSLTWSVIGGVVAVLFIWLAMP